ncbi:MAG: hypothetical protein ACM3S5_14905 [Rhodospirillales bacterium]
MVPGIPGDPAAGSDAFLPIDAAILRPEPVCTEVEIEINGSPDPAGDLVQLRSEHPDFRPVVKGRIRSKAPQPNAAIIVLTNPDGRLRFNGERTLSLTVPNSGAWAEFQILGETGSEAIGDAVIEAHCATDNGPLAGTRRLTVFWFDNAKIDLTPGGRYELSGGLYTSAAPAVRLKAEAAIRPAGVDASAPQVRNLRVGVMQTALAGNIGRITWGNPTVRFNPAVPAGIEVVVPQQVRLTLNLPITANTSGADSAPLCDRRGIKPPTGCEGGGPVWLDFTPSIPAPAAYVTDAVDAAGNKVGEVEYSLLDATVESSFIAYAVVWNQETQQVTALRQRRWSIHAGSAAAGPHRFAAEAADTAVTMPPLVGGPFAAEAAADPANRTTAPVPEAGLVKFIKP